MLSDPSFRSVFVFSINSLINSLILSGFPLTSFHLAETFLSAFSWLYTRVCAVVHKTLQNVFIFNYSQLKQSFCNQPVLFAQLENVNKLWNNNRTVHVNERNKTKTKPSHVTVKLTTRSIVRFNTQTMQWYYWVALLERMVGHGAFQLSFI